MKYFEKKDKYLAFDKYLLEGGMSDYQYEGIVITDIANWLLEGDTF